MTIPATATADDKLAGVFGRLSRALAVNLTCDAYLYDDRALRTIFGEREYRLREDGQAPGFGTEVCSPAGAPGTFNTDADTELVYVASTPYGAVSREAKAQLLQRK